MARPLSAARYRPLSEIVYDKLRQAIAQGQLTPGQRLRQETLANQLGVSRMPVREALQRLENEGLVEVVPHRGAVVRKPVARELTESLEALIILERSARELAFRRLTSSDLQALRRLQQAMRQRLDEGRMAEVADLNRRFHRSIVAACGLPKLCDCIVSIWDWHPQSMSMVANLRGAEAISEHDEILRALERGDLPAFQALCEGHMLASAKHVIDRVTAESAPAVETTKGTPGNPRSPAGLSPAASRVAGSPSPAE